MNAMQRRRANHAFPKPDNRANCCRDAFAFALSIQGRKRVHNADEPPGGDRRQARPSNVFERVLPRTSYGFGGSPYC